MTPAEAQTLLGMASAYDNRKPDETGDAAKAWAAALDGLRFEDCRLALIEHFKTSTDYLMPAMLRATVKRIRAKRIDAYGTLPDPPATIDPDDTKVLQRWQADIRRRIADGELQPEPDAAIEGRRNVLELGTVGKHVGAARGAIR